MRYLIAIPAACLNICFALRSANCGLLVYTYVPTPSLLESLLFTGTSPSRRTPEYWLKHGKN